MASPLHLRCISAASPLHLPCISLSLTLALTLTLTPKALETALRLRRGLLRRPHPPLVTPPLATPPLTPLVLGAGLQGLQGRLQERLQGLQGLQGAAPRGMPLGLGGEMPPLLRACLLLPLRMPTVPCEG